MKLPSYFAVRNIRLYLFLLCNLCMFNFVFSQRYTRTDTIPVKENGKWLRNPWVGGHNYCQFSEIDMNFDGIKDLFVFDRTGNKITTYINKGTPNMVDYYDSTLKYASKFPHLEQWALLRDYNCDGKPDIFTYGDTGIAVWKNVSSGGVLRFVLEKTLTSSYCPTVLNLHIIPSDIPTIDDIDGDGDLDILTYAPGGIDLKFHVNQSKELGYRCDSLIFKMDCDPCWGNFKTSLNGCNVTFGACRPANPDSSGHITDNNINGTRHEGNCSLCIDLDGDGDKDILLGQLGCCNTIQLTNGGNASSANMIAMDENFPSYNIPATLTSFPCGYFLDLNNDNKRDLVVSPNSPNVSLDNESIWYYLNIGTDKIPVFSRQTRSFLQKDMIDVGEGADPVFFDFNGDGLTDMLISNYAMEVDSCPASNLYGVWAFKNIGTSHTPKFELVDTDYANLSTALPEVTSKHLTFGDLDGDGDPDMCIGDFDGYVHYFKNTAGPGNPPSFTSVGLIMDASTNTPIDVGSYSTPQLIDIDRDGDLDLVIGERAGNVNYYQNTGSATSYSFKFISSTFGGVDVMKACCTGYSVPFIYDSLGSYKMIVGSESSKEYGNLMGWLWHYTNIDGNLAGNFTFTDSLYQNIWEGPRMTVSGSDINHDGSMDLIIGNYAGGVAIYLGDTSTVSVSELNRPQIDFSIYPNPSRGEINILISRIQPNEKPELTIYNTLGEKVFSFTYNTFSNGNTQQTLTVNTSSLPAGIYSCEIKAKSKNTPGSSKKLVLLK